MSVSAERERTGSALGVLTLYALLVWFVPQKYVVGPLGQMGSPADLVGVGCFLWWSITRIVPGLTVRAPHPVRVIAVADVVVTMALVGIAMRRPLTTIGGNGAMAALVDTVAGAGVILVAADGLPSMQAVRRFAGRLAIMTTALAGMGIVQWFSGYDIAANLKPPGLRLSVALEDLNVRSGFVRVQGTANHPIEFGVVLAVMLPVVLHLALFAPTRGRRTAWAFAATTTALALPLSVSRSGTVAAAVAIVGCLVPLAARYRTNLGAAALATIGVLAVATPGLIGTIRSLFENVGNDPSITARQTDFTDVARYVDEQPWFGRGPGTFNAVEYFILDNQYLSALVSTGAVGLTMTVLMLTTPIVLGVHLSRSSVDAADRHLAHSLAVGAGVGAVSAAFFDAFAFSVFSGSSCLILGVLGAMWRLRPASVEGTVPAMSDRADVVLSRRWVEPRW